jgi:hypothetical protein
LDLLFQLKADAMGGLSKSESSTTMSCWSILQGALALFWKLLRLRMEQRKRGTYVSRIAKRNDFTLATLCTIHCQSFRIPNQLTIDAFTGAKRV